MSELTALADRLAQVLRVMKAARRNQTNMNIWADDTKAVEDAHQILSSLAAQTPDLTAQLAAARSALEFYKDGFKYHPKKLRTGIDVSTWEPTEALLEDCGERAEKALSTLAQEPAGQSEIGVGLSTAKPEALINIETWERFPLTLTAPAGSASPGVTATVPLADHDAIGIAVLNQPWEVQKEIITITAHCTAIMDQAPSKEIADIAGCISQCCADLAAALSAHPTVKVSGDAAEMREPSSEEQRGHDVIDWLRGWREADHEDAITLYRTHVVALLAAIDANPAAKSGE